MDIIDDKELSAERDVVLEEIDGWLRLIDSKIEVLSASDHFKWRDVVGKLFARETNMRFLNSALQGVILLTILPIVRDKTEGVFSIISIGMVLTLLAIVLFRNAQNSYNFLLLSNRIYSVGMLDLFKELRNTFVNIKKNIDDSSDLESISVNLTLYNNLVDLDFKLYENRSFVVRLSDLVI